MDVGHLIVPIGDLAPALRVLDMMLIDAAVALLHDDEHGALGIDLGLHLTDLREVFSDLVAIARLRRAELVEPQLHPEVALLLGLLAAAWIARVVDALRVGRPCDVAAARAALHVLDHRLDVLAVEIVDVE
jgi:hypothetical protein